MTPTHADETSTNSPLQSNPNPTPFPNNPPTRKTKYINQSLHPPNQTTNPPPHTPSTHKKNKNRYIDEGGSRITGLGQVEEDGIELTLRFGDALALLLRVRRAGGRGGRLLWLLLLLVVVVAVVVVVVVVVVDRTWHAHALLWGRAGAAPPGGWDGMVVVVVMVVVVSD
jgi:hypothetical protein